MDLDLIARYRFFRAQGCMLVGHAAQCALAYARAEQAAERRGLVALYEDELEAWDGECPAPRYLVCVVVYRTRDVNRHGVPRVGADCLASLGMVGVDEYHDPYLRECAAQCFADALDALDAEDQEHANELAARGTYAAGE